MASVLNLSRNTRVFLTTNVNTSTGVLTDANSGFTATNTYEFQVLDGYSFGQTVANQSVQVNEAGNTPARGSRAFNTALNPGDFSFSTYLRPYKSAGAATVTAIEKCLWNAMFNSKDVDTTAGIAVTNLTRASTTVGLVTVSTAASFATYKAGDEINFIGTSGAVLSSEWAQPGTVVTEGTTSITVQLSKIPGTAAGTTSGACTAVSGAWAENGTAAGAYAYAGVAGSNKNQLQKFALIFAVDNVLYALDNCAMDTLTIDFGLDGIATAAWVGKCTQVKQLSTITVGGITSTAYSTSAQYITNKLSTATLGVNIGPANMANTTGVAGYSVPITGGSITFSNNLTYVTPSNLGVVNTPINYFTGGRVVSGSLNAYLRTGSGAAVGGTNLGDTGQLLKDMLATPVSETKYRMQLEIGGKTNSTRVEIEMPGVTLQVPTMQVQDIVSTTIAFQGQANDGSTNYDLTAANDAIVRYYTA